MNIFSNVLFHIPHSSKRIPKHCNSQFVLSKSALKNELILMSDYKTKALYSFDKRQKRLIAKVSRLVLNTERFVDDETEIMSKVGMGVIYTKTSNGSPLRRKISQKERNKLLKSYYHSHHKKFSQSVTRILDNYGKCLIIDCHSFSSFKQDYEITSSDERPQICLGTDSFHTSHELTKIAKNAFIKQGFEVGLNAPFAGSIVPLEFYEKDKRVSSIMIETRRDLYMDESSGKLRKDYLKVKARINGALKEICESF